MKEKIKRVYVDSSAVGGKFNKRLSEQTKPFWDAVERGEIIVIVSDMLDQEVENKKTPRRVQDFLDSLLEAHAVRITTSREVNDLAERYVIEGVVDEHSRNDCRHVALATIANADVLVSWNLKHMVERSNEYKHVNRILGYPEIEIQTPKKFMEAHHGKN